MSEMKRKYGVSLTKLGELKKFQIENRNKRVKMIDIAGTVSVIFKVNNEDAIVLLDSNLTIDENNITAKRLGFILYIPFSEILVYSINNLKIKIQFKQDYQMDTCTLHLQTAEQEEQILNAIPQMQRPLIDHKNSSCYDIFVFTLQKNGDDLFKALTDTKILNPKNRVVLYGILNEHYPTVLKALIHENITNFHATEMMLYYIPKDKALNFTVTCPDHVYIGQLDMTHIPIISAIWPHRFDGAERYLATFLEMNGGYGVFLKENDKLLAWVMRNHWGTLINLQTLPEYKRMGFGHLIVSVMSKKIAEEGCSPMATIVVGNFASEMLFKKLGFRHLHSCRFVTIE